MYNLTGKTILVTGASKGIGAATAARLGAAGASVVAHFASDREGAEHATRDIEASRKRLVAADFGKLNEVEYLWDEAEAWNGRVDVVVNNAAIMLFDGGVGIELDDWDRIWEQTLAVNVLATGRLLRRAVRHYLDQGGGSIVTISSWAAQKGVTNSDNIAYGASKAAAQNMTQTISRAYAKDGILAYCIAPGVVRTRLSEQFAASQGGEALITDGLAMREWVPPTDIAETVTFLASGVAKHLTGATLDLNGASYIR
jgi:NAD(P)-dependent dehydrogenase (short-subunit alcohol dehydrogenase family)